MNRTSLVSVAAILAVAGVGAWFLARPGQDLPKALIITDAPAPLARPDRGAPPTRPSATPDQTPATKPAPPSVVASTANGARAADSPHPPVHDYLPDRRPDEILPDGTHVYHNYPFQLKQPDGTYTTVPVTVTFKPIAALPVEPTDGGK